VETKKKYFDWQDCRKNPNYISC